MGGGRVQKAAVVGNVADVEQFIVFEPMGASGLVVRRDIVQLTKPFRELDVRFIRQIGMANDSEAMLLAC